MNTINDYTSNIEIKIYPTKMHEQPLQIEADNEFATFAKPFNGCYGLEQEMEKRQWIGNNVKLNGKHTFHEVINEHCKFYADIDDKQFVLWPEQFDELIETIKQHFAKFVCYHFKIEAQKVVTNFHISKTKHNSAHIVIDFIVDDVTYYIFKHPSDQKKFWKEYSKFLETINNIKFTNHIDLCVYRHNAQMRTIFSPKYNQSIDTMLVPYVGKYHIAKSVSSLFQNSKFEISTTKQYDQNNYMIAVNNVEFGNYKIFNIGDDNLIKPTFLTTYELLQIQDMLDKTKKNIDKLKDWRKAHYRIYCLNHYKPMEERKRIVREFFASRGWGLPMHKCENDMLCDYWNDNKYHHNFNVKSFVEFFGQDEEHKPIQFNKNIVEYPDMQIGDKKIVCMKSGTNTQKSRQFLMKYSHLNVLCVTYRVTLADELVNNAKSIGFEYHHYQKVDVKILTEIANNGGTLRLVCQLESLHKYESLMDRFDIIFLDESEALMGQFAHLFKICKGNVQMFKKTESMFNYFMNEKNIIFCSANLGERTFAFINKYKRPFEFYENLYVDKNGWKCNVFDKSIEFFEKIFDLAKNG